MIVASRWTVFVVAGLVSIAAGCNDEPAPCVPFALKQGRSYRLTLLEAYDASATMARYDPAIDQRQLGRSCGSWPSVGPHTGDILEFAVGPRDQDSGGGLPCTISRIVPKPWKDTDFLEFGRTGGSTETLASFAALTRFTSCVGWLHLDVRVPDKGDPLRAPIRDELPPVLVYRSVGKSGAADECAFSCDDNWIAKLDPVAP